MHQLEKLQAKIPPRTALLLSNTGDIRYFAHFEILVPEEREALLLVTQKSATLLHANFSPVQAQVGIEAVPGCQPEVLKKKLLQISGRERIRELWIDKNTLFVSELEAVREIGGLKITGLDRTMIWNLRSVKTADEIAAIKMACQMTVKALKQVMARLEPGMTELEVKKMLEESLRALGSEASAFPTIVAFGEHTALPHHQPTGAQLKKNLPVVIDIGASYQGYCSDMTRTFWFGDQPAEKFVEIEEVVQAAYQVALEKLGNLGGGGSAGDAGSGKLSDGLSAKDLDWAVRNYIASQGYGPNFIHTTGHGLGLAIHEQPSLSWLNDTPLQPGMVLTIEPGIYLTGEFGYRHENTVLLGKKVEELTWT